MSGYTVVNTILIAKKFWKGYEGHELRGSAYNLFDRDYTSPTPTGPPSLDPALPNDMPRLGKIYLVELKCTF